MTDLRTAAQMALDIMLAAIKAGDWKVDGACDPDYVFETLRAALAQGEQEPVAWVEAPINITEEPMRTWLWDRNYSVIDTDDLKKLMHKKEWQGLTDEEINTIAATPAAIPGSYVHSFARTIEAKLKDKNI